MEKEGKNKRETDFLLQWGNRKRLRCIKMNGQDLSEKSDRVVRRRTTSRTDRKEAPSLNPNRLNRNSDSVATSENRKSGSCSPEKEDRYYSTRGSGLEESGKIFTDLGFERGFVWPKLFVSLSSKEKEEDFMSMKGCKLPQRPKKRAKFIQKSVQLVSPGTWLSDLCHERYEVREKKSSKKRRRGLKAMGCTESDSE
ncbi:uncharacterized protein LOC143845711 [Tasmannia lanceolata]|uniref:uncharacterized protein LOC143845711 n=1 Tax=Tasmannia lanceolata TaxID=3420 RepID=UPI00406422F6